MPGMTITEQKINDTVTVLELSNVHATARVSLFGGQVLSFCPRKDGRERFYLSNLARLDGSKSIRGGVPICWPWFGSNQHDATLPAHGYMRTRQWRLINTESSSSETTFLFQPDTTSGPGFKGQAELLLRIVLGTALEISLITRNTGTAAFPLSMALHSYFAVDDIYHTHLQGISGNYSDKTRNWQHFVTPEPYGFREETDRIHLEACPEVKIITPAHSTTVHSHGHDSVVVWNPWTGCKQNFVDMEAEDYTRMLCVETALTQGLLLAPGNTRILTQLID